MAGCDIIVNDSYTQGVSATFGQADHCCSISSNDEWNCNDCLLCMCVYVYVRERHPPPSSPTEITYHLLFFFSQVSKVRVCSSVSVYSHCNFIAVSHMERKKEVIVGLCRIEKRKRCRRRKTFCGIKMKGGHFYSHMCWQKMDDNFVGIYAFFFFICRTYQERGTLNKLASLSTACPFIELPTFHDLFIFFRMCLRWCLYFQL